MGDSFQIKHHVSPPVQVDVFDEDGNNLVLHTAVRHDSDVECNVTVNVAGRHRVTVTNGEQTYAEWIEVRYCPLGPPSEERPLKYAWCSECDQVRKSNLDCPMMAT